MKLTKNEAIERVLRINNTLREKGLKWPEIERFWDEVFRDAKRMQQSDIKYVVFFDKNVVGISMWMLGPDRKVKYVKTGDRQSWVGTQVDTKIIKKGIKLKVTNGRYNNRTLHPMVVTVINTKK